MVLATVLATFCMAKRARTGTCHFRKKNIITWFLPPSDHVQNNFQNGKNQFLPVSNHNHNNKIILDDCSTVDERGHVKNR